MLAEKQLDLKTKKGNYIYHILTKRTKILFQ